MCYDALQLHCSYLCIFFGVPFKKKKKLKKTPDQEFLDLFGRQKRPRTSPEAAAIFFFDKALDAVKKNSGQCKSNPVKSSVS